jgi:predicted acylesterase/phospholipase RssA
VGSGAGRIARAAIALVVVAAVTAGCTPGYRCLRLPPRDANVVDTPSFVLRSPRERVALILALSGGGSRAAYFSASAMFALQRRFKDHGVDDVLSEVDAISSVSGGSLPAAYYALSRNAANKMPWDQARVTSLMATNFIGRWIARWFYPWTFAKYWTFQQTRSDLMAEEFESTLYGHKTFADLPARPQLILNATDATDGPGEGNPFSVFTFTVEDYETYMDAEPLGPLRISTAVMASSAFPAVFPYINIPHRVLPAPRVPTGLCERVRYRHLFDGGNADNLGLSAIDKIIHHRGNARFQKFYVVLVDAHVREQGISAAVRDTRSLGDLIVDSNFIRTYDSLLGEQHGSKLKHTENSRKLQMCRIAFDLTTSDPVLYTAVNEIPTTFRLTLEEASTIDRAVERLVGRWKENTPELSQAEKKLQKCLDDVAEAVRSDRVPLRQLQEPERPELLKRLHGRRSLEDEDHPGTED